jgi:short-subunit dehydrogenase
LKYEELPPAAFIKSLHEKPALIIMPIQNPNGTAVVTGASTSIGAIYADRLARRGFDLLIIARHSKRLTDLASELTKKTGRRVDIISANLTNKQDLRKIESRLHSDTSISLLVNNAGFGGTKSIVHSSIDDLEDRIALNVTALTRLTAAVLPNLLTRKQGAIINIASAVALNPELLNGTYSGTKAYVVNFTQSLFETLKNTGVQVQAVLPGVTRTEFWDRAGLPIHNLPDDFVMSADNCVDAALVGLDRHELITIPALPDIHLWNRYDEARRALYPFLSNREAAKRYGIHG